MGNNYLTGNCGRAVREQNSTLPTKMETTMNWKTGVLLLVLLDFAALTAWALYEVGYLGIFAAGLSGPASMQILADLVILGGLACLWIIADARARGANPWPYVVITLFAGAFGPLLFLLARQRR